MANLQAPEAEALRRAVSEVLHYVWDPIGVASVVAARNEYEGYVEPICHLLWAGASPAEIRAELLRLSDENMGVPGTQAAADLAASKLVEWRSAVTR